MEGQGLHEGQLLWLQDGGHRSNWSPVKIVKICKQYVVASDGHKYNLVEGRKDGSRRGFSGGMWDSPPYVTVEDRSQAYEAQEFRLRKDRAVHALQKLDGLTAEQFSQILAIAESKSEAAIADVHRSQLLTSTQ